MLARETQSRKLPKIRYRCPSCREKHAGLPALAYRLPDAIYALEPEERSSRADVSSEMCTLDGDRFFVRSVLQLPIRDITETFDFGPWIEVSGGDFARYAVHAQASPGSAQTLLGAMANELPLYPRALGLACAIGYGVGENDRPLVTIVDGDHPLSRAQRHGIDLPRVTELVSTMKGFVMLVE